MYRHTQVAYWMPVIALALAGLIGVRAGTRTPAVLVLVLMLLVWGLFGTLTTVVERDEFSCRFGPVGLIRRRLRLGDIRAARAVRTSPLWGWGLRWTPRGWLWNVWGLDAVEFELVSGGRFLVGTDEPQRLLAALRGRGVAAT